MQIPDITILETRGIEVTANNDKKHPVVIGKFNDTDEFIIMSNVNPFFCFIEDSLNEALGKARHVLSVFYSEECQRVITGRSGFKIQDMSEINGSTADR